MRRHLLVSNGGIDIIANGGRGVSLDFTIDQIRAIQHPQAARVSRRDDVYELNRRPWDVAACYQDGILRQSHVVFEHGLRFKDDHDVELFTPPPGR